MRLLTRRIDRRLGRCATCMRASLAISAAAWVGVLWFDWSGSARGAKLMLGAAIASSALLALHTLRWIMLRRTGRIAARGG